MQNAIVVGINISSRFTISGSFLKVIYVLYHLSRLSFFLLAFPCSFPYISRCYISSLKDIQQHIRIFLSLRNQQRAMCLRLELHVLTTVFTLISSATLLRKDAAINTVEDFLDTLINSSHYDRRIRPFLDQRS